MKIKWNRRNIRPKPYKHKDTGRRTVGKLYWFIHHARMFEGASEPIRNRIRFIKRQKSTRERAIRLAWMRPVKRPDLLPDGGQLSLDTYFRRLRARHKAECPGCPVTYRSGSGGELIFPDWETWDTLKKPAKAKKRTPQPKAGRTKRRARLQP